MGKPVHVYVTSYFGLLHRLHGVHTITINAVSHAGKDEANTQDKHTLPICLPTGVIATSVRMVVLLFGRLN